MELTVTGVANTRERVRGNSVPVTYITLSDGRRLRGWKELGRIMGATAGTARFRLNRHGLNNPKVFSDEQRPKSRSNEIVERGCKNGNCCNTFRAPRKSMRVYCSTQCRNEWSRFANEGNEEWRALGDDDRKPVRDITFVEILQN